MYKPFEYNYKNDCFNIYMHAFWIESKTAGKFVEHKNVVWLINYKAGCTSVVHSLFDYSTLQSPKVFIKEHNLKNDSKLLENCNKDIIVFVRDPIDRFLSAMNYAYISKAIPYNHLIVKESKLLSIDNFLQYAIMNNSIVNIDYTDPHVLSQTKWLKYLNVFDNKKLKIYDCKDIKTVMESRGYNFHLLNESPKKIYTREDLTRGQIEQLLYTYKDDIDFINKNITHNYKK